MAREISLAILHFVLVNSEYFAKNTEKHSDSVKKSDICKIKIQRNETQNTE